MALIFSSSVSIAAATLFLNRLKSVMLRAKVLPVVPLLSVSIEAAALIVTPLMLFPVTDDAPGDELSEVMA